MCWPILSLQIRLSKCQRLQLSEYSPYRSVVICVKRVTGHVALIFAYSSKNQLQLMMAEITHDLAPDTSFYCDEVLSAVPAPGASF